MNKTQKELVEEIFNGYYMDFISFDEAMQDLKAVLDLSHELLQGE